MADFSPDLERLLPSAMFSEDKGERRRHHHHHRQSFFSDAVGELDSPSEPDDLALRLAAFGLLRGNQQPVGVRKPRPNPSPAQGHGQAGPGYGYGVGGGYGPPAAGRVVVGHRNGGYAAGSRQAYPLKPVNPAHAQVEWAAESYGRARMMQNPAGGRFFPVRVGGPVRESGGTGVFLPRVVQNDSGKKPNIAGEHQRQEPMRGAGAAAAEGKQGMSIQNPTETGLPQDWTY